ncbi:MAG: autotransporter domain-containing protein [Candidatus Spyradosoma sp.]
MIRPFRLSLTMLFAGAVALSAAETAVQIPPTSVLDDPYLGSQWQWNPAKNGIEIAGAWQAGHMGSGVVIGVIDEWLDPEHPDLAPNYSTQWSKDFIGSARDDDEVMYSSESHGTFVAGMAAARGNNGIGISGAAPYAQLAGLHVGNGNGTMSSSAILQAYWYGAGWGTNTETQTGKPISDAAIHIKNCSYGYTPYFVAKLSDDVKTALTQTTRNNTIYVFAAGNDRNKKTTPSDANGSAEQNFEGGIVVGSTHQGGYYSAFSSYGANLFVCAPGENVYSASRDGISVKNEDEGDSDTTSALAAAASGGNDQVNYAYSSGTSYAAPVVSGVIALAAADNVAMDSRWAKHALARSCDVLPQMEDASKSKDTVWTTNSAGFRFSNDYGFGMVNATNFVEVAADIAYETIRTTTTPDVALSSNASSWTRRGDPVVATVKVSETPLEQKIESVEVTFTIDNINYFKDAKVVLVSPNGTESVLLDQASLSSSADGADAFKTAYDSVTAANGTTALTWTFVSNAFWGVDTSVETGDWQVKFINDGNTTGRVSDVSVKFNTGDVVMESSSMLIDSTRDVHALVLDRSSTSCVVASASSAGTAANLRVEDSVILNAGSLTVKDGGVISSYDGENWKGLKVYVNGGTLDLAAGGTIDAPRGIEIDAGTLKLNGGTLESGTLSIYGGVVAAIQNESSLSGVDLRGGVLRTNDAGTLEIASFSMTGGTFDMGGTNKFALSPTGGLVNVTGAETRVNSATIGATETTAASIYVPAGKKLVVGNIDAEGGSLEVLSVRGFYQAATVPAEGEEGEGTPEKINRATAVFAGEVNSGGVSISTAAATIAGATFSGTGGLQVAQKSEVALSGEISVSGASGVSVGGGSVVRAASGATILAAAVSLGGDSTLSLGGDLAIANSADAESTSFRCTGGTIELTAGDMLKVDGAVSISGNEGGESTIKLAFVGKLPSDKINFIEADSVSVSDTVVTLDASAPTVWDGTREIDLNYVINANGEIEADMPEGVEVSPLRLTYASMSGEQKAIAHSLRLCLDDPALKAENAVLLGQLNAFEYLGDLLAAYDQFLPVNLKTVNMLHDMQASATTGALERRSRELRTGFPISDLWSAPLFNSYGFSFSANPNAVAANGMRQFAGYELNRQRAMLWANGGYSFSKGDAAGNAPKTETDLTNAFIGFDYALSDRLAVGLFVGYTDGKTEMKATDSESDVSMRSVGVYFAGSNNNREGSFYYMGMASYGMGEYDFTRTTQIGSYSGRASASPDGSQAIGYLALGYEWEAGSQALTYQWTTGPTASLRYAYNSIDGYTENGSGADRLTTDDFSYDSLVSTLGWRATVRFDVKECITFVPEARIAWKHEFLDGAEDVDARLAIPGSTPFTTEMNKSGADSVTAGLGVTVLIAESTTVSFDYDCTFLREDADPEHCFNLMVRCRF